MQHQVGPQVNCFLVDGGGKGSVNADGGAVGMTELGYLGYIYTPAEPSVSAEMVVPRKVNVFVNSPSGSSYIPCNIIDQLCLPVR